jgi:hypothetical protein
MTQVAEHLVRKHEAMSSNLNIANVGGGGEAISLYNKEYELISGGAMNDMATKGER